MATVARKATAAPAPARARPARAPTAARSPAAASPGGPAVKLAGPAAKSSRFRAVVAKLKAVAARVASHVPAGRKAAEAQAAAVPPPRERAAGAQANQVAAMQEAKVATPEPSGFLALLRKAIEAAMPKTLDDATKFMDEGQQGKLKGAVQGEVQQQQAAAAGPTQDAAGAAPDESRVPGKPVEPMPAEPAPATPTADVGGAVPEPRPQADLASFPSSQLEADRRMAEAELTPRQLQAANDPRFTKVVTSRDGVRRQADAAPGRYRAAERGELARAAAAVQAQGKQGLVALAGVRGRSNAAVLARQLAAKQRDEARRKEVTAKVEAIYARTRKAVEARLDGLERDALALFDAGADVALKRMKEHADREIARFKAERYGGLLGKGRWLADLFSDTPEGIKVILRQARDRFVGEMDALAVRIAATVDQRVADAKAEVTRGQGEIATYVAGLPKDLQAVGKAAEGEVAGRFEELRQGIDARQEELARKLADKYKETTEKADAELKKLEEANKGALKGLVDAIGDVIKAIAEFGEKLMAVFKKGWATIKLIVAHPIDFLGNLLAAVKKGFGQFVDRIWEHLKAGFLSWLFGSLAEAGIEVPKDFTLGSILKLVLAVLGITYPRMREKAVKLVGERAVSILEKVFELLHTLVTAGPAKLWEEVKEWLSDLKAQVIDALQEWVITTIIKSAVTKLATMFNPVGAIVQAVLTIYNVVMFFIENAKKILALIEAIVESVAAIASGAIASAANWIEKSLARFIPVVIGFLARLLGLGGISDKIKQIIKKVQAAVDRAIDKVIAKIVGVVKKLFASGKAAVKSALQWWRKRKAFRADGEEHELSFQGEGRSAKPMMASKIRKGVRQVIEDSSASKGKKDEALLVVREIEMLMGGQDEKAIEQGVQAKLDLLATKLASMPLTGPQDLPLSKVTFARKGASAGTVTADPLTLRAGNTQGSEATALPIPGWVIAGGTNRASRNVWVRAHLLSYRLHGPGNQSWNLTPATQSANQRMAQIEKAAAQAIARKATIRYVTEVTYRGAGKHMVQFFPEKISVSFQELDATLNPKPGGTKMALPDVKSDDPQDRLLRELKGSARSLNRPDLDQDLLMLLGGLPASAAAAIVAHRGSKLHASDWKDRLRNAKVAQSDIAAIEAAISAGSLWVPK